MKLKLIQQQILDWDLKLKKTPQNPFPLAPQHLVEKAFMTTQIYEEQNRMWGENITNIMVAESLQGGLCILGAGLLRDLDWIPQKIQEGCSVSIVDSSKVACKNARNFLKKYSLEKQVRIIKTDILTVWKKRKIDESKIQAYFISQFLEHQRADLPEFITHFTKFLKIPGRTLYIITPRKEDNENVEWKDTDPLDDSEWKEVLERDVGKSMEILDKLTYYDRNYTFFKFRS